MTTKYVWPIFSEAEAKAILSAAEQVHYGTLLDGHTPNRPTLARAMRELKKTIERRYAQ